MLMHHQTQMHLTAAAQPSGNNWLASQHILVSGVEHSTTQMSSQLQQFENVPRMNPTTLTVCNYRSISLLISSALMPTPPPPPPAANRPPTVKARCEPCVVEIGKTSTVTADAQDPDGDGALAEPSHHHEHVTAEDKSMHHGHHHEHDH